MGRPTRYNVDLVRGDTKTYSLNFTSDGTTPIDITGWTIYYTVKNAFDDPDDNAIIRKIITTHLDPTHGQTEIVLLNTDTQNVIPDVYWHDIQVKNTDNKINTIIVGQLNVIADVTQAH